MKAIIIAPGLDNYLAINCLNKEKPEVVAFILTEKTVELLPEIFENLKYKPVDYRKFFVKDITSITESVQEFFNAFRWLTEIKKIKRIIVDATNVLTTIGFPVYFVASFIEVFKDLIVEDVDIKMIFTTCDWKVIKTKLHAVGEPIIGTEKIIELEHPMNTIGFILGTIASDLFNRGFYPRAKKIFEILEKHTLGEQNLLYTGLSSLSHAYDLWDKFNIKAAKEELEKSIYILSKITKFGFIGNLIKEANLGLEILEKIQEGDWVEKILDIFENGNRRMREEKFDDAVARYYRCLDMTAQYSLIKHKIDTKKPNFSKLSQNLVEKYQKERGGILPNKYKDGIGGIALKDAFLLLYCLDNPLGQEYKKIESKFIGLLTLRNESILAHGTKSIIKKNAEKFKEEIVKPFLIKLSEIEGFNLNEKLKKHQFPELPTNIKNLFLKE
jgi:CRISPR-associated protein (TIGR02710 family)